MFDCTIKMNRKKDEMMLHIVEVNVICVTDTSYKSVLFSLV